MEARKYAVSLEEKRIKERIKEVLQPDEYQGWLDALEIVITPQETILAGIPHPVFRYDIKKNYLSLFRSLLKEIFPQAPDTITVYVGKYAPSFSTQPPEKIIGHEKPQSEQLEFALPELWSEHHVEYPTDLTRISPFRPLKRGQQREFVQRVLLQNKYGRIQYEGRMLGIDDEDVFMMLLREARENLFQGKEIIKVTLSIRSFLKRLGRPIGGSGQVWLEGSLNRLTGGRMNFETPRFKLAGCLIDGWTLDEETKECIVRLNPQIGRIYVKRAYTQIDFQQRLNLQGDICKKLHAFLNGQRNKNRRFSFTDKEMQETLNSEAPIRELRRKLKSALTQLIKVGFLERYYCESGGKNQIRYFVEYAGFSKQQK